MRTEDAKTEFLKFCEDKKLSPLTVKWYRLALNAFSEQFPELPTEAKTIQDYIRTASSGHGDERAHGIFRILRAFYRYLWKLHDLPNVFEKVEAPKRKHKEKDIPSPFEIKQLLASDLLKWERALICFLLDTGARIGEVANLKPADILPDGFIRLDGKTGERTIPLSADVLAMLRDLKDEDFRDGNNRVCQRTDTVFRFGEKTLSQAVSQAFIKAGLRKYGPHTLRHYFCTYYSGKATNLQRITGHSTLAMVEHYSHYRHDLAKADHDQHSPLRRLLNPGEPIPDESRPPVRVDQKVVLSCASNAPPLRKGEVERLLAYPYHKRWVKALMTMILETGAELSEACCLKLEDIGLKDMKLRYRGLERMVLISPNLRGMLLDLTVEDFAGSRCREERREYVFKVTLHACETAIIKSLAKLGLSGTQYTLRATYNESRNQPPEVSLQPGAPPAIATLINNLEIPEVKAQDAEVVSCKGDRVTISIPANLIAGRTLNLHISLG